MTTLCDVIFELCREIKEFHDLPNHEITVQLPLTWVAREFEYYEEPRIAVGIKSGRAIFRSPYEGMFWGRKAFVNYWLRLMTPQAMLLGEIAATKYPFPNTLRPSILRPTGALKVILNLSHSMVANPEWDGSSLSGSDSDSDSDSDSILSGGVGPPPVPAPPPLKPEEDGGMPMDMDFIDQQLITPMA